MINNPVTISSKMLIIMMGITIITWFMYIGIMNASCNWGCSITNDDTCHCVTDRHIGAIINIG